MLTSEERKVGRVALSLEGAKGAAIGARGAWRG